MKCRHCGYDDNGTGDSAHVCLGPWSGRQRLAQVDDASHTGIVQLNRAFENGLEALRVCAADEQLSPRTAEKVNRAIVRMCNAIPLLDLLPADAIDPKALAELQAAYKDFFQN